MLKPIKDPTWERLLPYLTSRDRAILSETKDPETIEALIKKYNLTDDQAKKLRAKITR